MPFSQTTKHHPQEYWTDHFEKVLRPIIEDVPNLKARRSEPLRENIIGQIITDLWSSAIVVADLTDHNPNVFWELGVRQTFKHGTVTIAEEGTSLPFDLGGKATLFYPKEGGAKWESFRRRFKAAIRDCMKNPNKPDSIVIQSVSGRGTLFEIFERDEAIRRLEALLDELQRNQQVLHRISKRAQSNLKKTSKRATVTTTLLTPAIELLIANRYLNETRPFYTVASLCLGFASAINERLTLWPHFKETTDMWLIRNIEGPHMAKDVLRKFRTHVKIVHETLQQA